MELLQPNQKSMKFSDEAKNIESKENIENNNEHDKNKHNSSSSLRAVPQNSSSMIDENEEPKTKQKQQNSNMVNNHSKNDSKEEKNTKIEENNKRSSQINDFSFANPTKKRKMTLNYIRIRKTEFLPRNDIYEATDGDLNYIEAFNKKHNDNTPLTIEIFEQLIALWENNSDKDYPISLPQAKSLIVEKIEKSLSNKIEEVYEVNLFSTLII